MSEGPNVKGNPLRVVVILLVFSYVLGEFILPKFPILYLLKLIGILGLIFSVGMLGVTGGAGLGPAATKPCPSALWAGKLFFAILTDGNAASLGELGKFLVMARRSTIRMIYYRQHDYLKASSFIEILSRGEICNVDPYYLSA